MEEEKGKDFKMHSIFRYYSLEYVSALSFFAICLAAGVSANGEFEVLLSPNSLKWVPQPSVLEVLLKDIYSASLGIHTEPSSEWYGLLIKNPFACPEAVVEVYVDGVTNLGGADTGHVVRYPILNHEHLNIFIEMCRSILSSRHPNSGRYKNTLLHLTLNDETDLERNGVVFGMIRIYDKINVITDYLKPETVDCDSVFLRELDVLDQISDKVMGSESFIDYNVDFYHLRFTSLRALSDKHGSNSNQTREANKLLGEALKRLSAAFFKVYSGRVLVTTVYSDAHALTRRTVRSISSFKTGPRGENIVTNTYTKPKEQLRKPPNKHNTADPDPNYPVFFHIFLWMTIIYVLIFIAVVYIITSIDISSDRILSLPVKPQLLKEELYADKRPIFPEYNIEMRKLGPLRRKVNKPVPPECRPTTRARRCEVVDGARPLTSTTQRPELNL